ncbi:GNAT family N-acetyltransferase [Streptomyces sp. DT24]|uniref:GNAT family N-acetyltransferase n=1 Tax=unclassified Streptomyces TaxID=2593676 RepID=UPI0023B99BC1|nr:GNAT family N-acetyltransferase [Streptomyces sp. AM 4-1-1]WEH36352.1 GNAT family N-acetyltransferase [Streptomyces sp. AM 4-1-1]
MNLDVRLRHISDRDWDGIVALESGAYAALGLSEDRAALESRVRASPGTCFVLDLGQRLAGYLLALPYPMFRYPDLTRAEQTDFHSRNLHLHDLVIAEDLRGRGLAKQFLHHVTATAAAQGYERMSLVAVGGTDTYWAANGFVAHPGVVPPGGYGTDAVYMSTTVRVDRAEKSKPTGAVLRGSSLQDEVG